MSVGGFDFHMLVKIIKASALVIRKILLSFSFYAFFLAEIGRANFFFFFTIWAEKCFEMFLLRAILSIMKNVRDTK